MTNYNSSMKVSIRKQKEYSLKPKLCKECLGIIPYKLRHTHKFCNHTCAATYTNKSRNYKYTHSCEYCKKDIVGKAKRNNRFCNFKCEKEFKNKLLIDSWMSGEMIPYDLKSGQLKKFVRNFLLNLREYSCEGCGWNKINPFTKKPILEIHHIDGDWRNSTLENLKVLCPNCHAMTENYKARNKGNGREVRRIV